ncbi:MAG: NAD-dependent epimerase/dehydratase family protein [Pseudomonadota bacterium]
MTKTAFVTGGTGFLGRNLIEQLVKQRWSVVAINRSEPPPPHLSHDAITTVPADVLDAGAMVDAMPEAVDAVFHVAGNTSTWSRHNDIQYRVNVEGTRNVVAAAQRRGARRFIHTSTWNVYGFWQPVISEESPQMGISSPVNYDRTKAQAEKEVRAAVDRGLDAVIINPSHIIGRYDPANWSRMVRMVAENRLPGVPPGAGSFCHAEQVALAHIAAVDRGRTGKNYLLGGTDATFLEVVAAIGKITGKKVPSRPLPAMAVKLVGRWQAMVAAVSGRPPEISPEGAMLVSAAPHIVSERAQRELGYRPVPLETMLQDCWQWLLSEGLVKL